MKPHSDIGYQIRLFRATCRLRELGGTLLIIKGTSCLMVERNRISEPEVKAEDWEATEIEIEAAKHLYMSSNCARV